MSSSLTIPTGRAPARVLVALLAIILAVLGIRLELSFALIRTNPDVSYAIDPSNAEASAAWANKRMFEAKNAADAERVRVLAISALRQSAYAPQALRNIGFIDVVSRGEDAAQPILKVAARGSLRDFLVHVWLFGRYYHAGAVPQAVHQADIVLSQQVDRWNAIMPLVIELLDDPRTVRPLVNALARKPYWRGTFLERMGLDLHNTATKYMLLSELKRRSQVTATELTPYFATIAETTPPETLRRRWLALVDYRARGGALLVDGSFDGVKLPPPYSWTFYPKDEVYAELQRRTDGKGNALYASFDGRITSSFAMQRLALTSGRYRLSGEILSEDGARPNQFFLEIKCGSAQATGRAIGRFGLAADVNQHEWRRFAVAFSVPQGCMSQTLQLSADGVENGELSTLWIDSLDITPIVLRSGSAQ